jgi:hypothetical protein
MLTTNDFRLRIDDEIVGYERTTGNYTLFSLNLFNWNGKPIEFKQKDRCTSFQDKSNNWIFEEDIIKSTDYPQNTFAVTYDHLLTKFLLVEINDEVIFEHSIQLVCKDKSKVTRITYGFIN